MSTRGDLTPADLVVLWMLAARPTHGYKLVAELERCEVGDWAAVSRAQIYYSLKKLAKRGLIRTARDTGTPAGPEREMFRTTPGGSRAMARSLARLDWARSRPPLPFHTWICLARSAEPADRTAMLAERRRYMQGQIEKEVATLEAIRGDPGPNQAMALAVVGHAIEMFRMELALVDRIEPILG